MASIREIKCPSCGAENGPCLVVNGQEMYHEERKRAAYPTTYEHPDCAECRQLKDRMVRAEYGVTAFGPTFCGGKPKSKWSKGFKDEFRNRELAANEARAEYEYHLGTVHKDEGHQRDLIQNLEIIMREGRLKP
jgi:hypothetical protein